MPQNGLDGDQAAISVVIGQAELIDDLEHVWLSLFDCHKSIGGGGLALVERSASWPNARAFYQRLLADPSAFAVAARRGKRVVGYAAAHVHPGADDTWRTGEGGFGEIDTVAVLPGERGAGLGSQLLDVAEAHFASNGVQAVLLNVMNGNDAAMRFYRRRGMTPVMTMYMRLGPRDRA
jgi:ribosomal protein S18 acetylase RimI-like enzyme